MESVTLIEKRKVIDIPENKIFGYAEKYHYIGLYRSDSRDGNGNYLFIASVQDVEYSLKHNQPISKTWVSELNAQIFIANAVIDELINEEAQP